MASLFSRFVQRYGRLPTEIDPDYLEMLRMSKYRVLARPDVNPAKCANCGSAKEDGRCYIDFGLQVDWFGAVFLCSFCLNDIAVAVGLFKKYEEKIAELHSQVSATTALTQQGIELKETILHVFEEVKTHFNNLPTTGASSTSDTSSDVDTSTPTSESGVSEAESGTTKEEQRTAKSPSGSGSKDISTLAELLKLDT